MQKKVFSAQAQRALEEARLRRQQQEAQKATTIEEIDGRGGKDPARYGDWEIAGRAVDF